MIIKSGKENKEDLASYVTGGILYDDGSVDSFEEIDKKKKKIKGQKNYGDIDTDKIIETEKTFSGMAKLETPPYSMLSLTKLPLLNTFHNKCIAIKAADVVGKGYRIELIEGYSKDDSQLKRLQEFVEQAPEAGRTFGQIISNWVIDRLTTGNGALEIARDIKRMPVLLAHIPFYTLRPHEDGKRWCHIVGSEKVWFKRFGVEQNFNKRTGEEQSGFDRDSSAHGLILLQRYTSLSSYYGIPEIISAVSAIMGHKFAADYNLQFFQNNAIPRYAIIVRGGKLTTELKSKIKNYFTREIKGNAHSTLFFEIPAIEIGMPSIEIEFKELDVREKESSFKLYNRDLIQEILVANGVPPYKIGIAIQGSLGGNLGEELIENYANTEIEPLQTEAEDLFYLVTKEIAPNYILRWNDLDIKNEEKLCKINTEYVGKSIMSLNEAREMIGLSNVGDAGDKLYIFTNMGAIEIATVPVKNKSGKRINRLYNDKIKEFKKELEEYERL